MVAVVGHDCKRLVRESIEDLNILNLKVGEVLEIDESAFFTKLKIDNWELPLPHKPNNFGKETI